MASAEGLSPRGLSSQGGLWPAWPGIHLLVGRLDDEVVVDLLYGIGTHRQQCAA